MSHLSLTQGLELFSPLTWFSPVPYLSTSECILWDTLDINQLILTYSSLCLTSRSQVISSPDNVIRNKTNTHSKCFAKKPGKSEPGQREPFLPSSLMSISLFCSWIFIGLFPQTDHMFPKCAQLLLKDLNCEKLHFLSYNVLIVTFIVNSVTWFTWV